jgi:hypothetical protein
MRNMTGTRTTEKRWIVLSQDGRHVTLGRHTDPSEEEIARAAEGLRSSGVGGWLAVTEGGYYTRGAVSILEVRELVPSPVAWRDAVRAFQAARIQIVEQAAPSTP